jgi:hypothetical protein
MNDQLNRHAIAPDDPRGAAAEAFWRRENLRFVSRITGCLKLHASSAN